MQQQGFGKVIGVDIDPETLAYAKNKYSDIALYNADVMNIAEIINRPADIIYMFNAFYAFTDQSGALSALNEIAHKHTQLVIFDYTAPTANLELKKAMHVTRNPIDLTLMADNLLQTGWQMQKTMDLTAEYQRWYMIFVQEIIAKKPQIVFASNEEVYQFVYETYSGILADIENGLLGGAIIYATKAL